MNPTVEIKRMSYGTAGIGQLPDGKTVFVEGAAPGDVATVEITEDKPSFARARVVEVVEASPSRVAPQSPDDEVAGTAPWQHIAYDAQLHEKRENVVSQLVRTAHVASDVADGLVADCLPSKRQWGYRNKVELGCTTGSDGLLEVGFYRGGTNELVSVGTTRLAHKAIERSPKALRGALRFSQGTRDLGIYRIGVRHSLATGDLEIALWTRPGAFPRGLFAKTLSTALKATSVVRVLADEGKARKVKGVEILEGRGSWREKIGDATFTTTAPSFFQVNTAQAGRLVETVLAGLGDVDGAFVADLYSGGGTFSIPLALAGADVVAVESAGSSVRDLRRNAEANGVEIEVVGGDAARELDDLEGIEALVVDPPRAGLADGVPDQIAALAPERVAYVSCNPATWARDVERFAHCGYELASVQPVDMFPQTYHVEIASIFQPA